MPHERTGSSDSTLISTSQISSTSTELHIYKSISENIRTFQDADHNLESLERKARKLIEHLEKSDEHNLYYGSGMNVLNPQRLHMVLDSMLRCVTGEESAAYATKAILVCGTRARIDDVSDAEQHITLLEGLKSLAIIWLTKFLFPFKVCNTTRENKYYNPYAEIPTPTLKSTTSELLLKRAREKALQRDAHRCVITGMRDRNHPKPGILELDLAHILDLRNMNLDHKIGHDDEISLLSVNVTLDIIKNYTQLTEEHLRSVETWTDQPRNLLSLFQTMHSLFDTFKICLKPDLTGLDHLYRLEYFGNDEVLNFIKRFVEDRDFLPPYPVVFVNHGVHSDEMPDPDLVKIHAAIARVLHMSGAGKFFDELLRKYPLPDNLPAPLTWDGYERHIEANRAANCLAQSGSLGISTA